MISLIFDHAQAIGNDTHTFHFRPQQPFSYTAGQFIEVYLPHDGTDNRGFRRYFTLSSSPTEPLLAITTKFTGTAGSSFKQHLQALTPGTAVQATEAMGDFVLPKDKTIPIVCIAAGIGATPVRSMVKWLTDTNQERHVSLIQTGSTPQALLFQDVWHGYPVHYTGRVSTRAGSAQHARAQTALATLEDSARSMPYSAGPLTAQFILETAPPDARNLYYLSGPEQLVEVLTKDTIAAGIPDYRVITDYFHGYAA